MATTSVLLPSSVAPHRSPAAEPDSLSPHVANGLAWGALSSILRQAITFVSVTTLTHLLAPSAYGLAAMAAVGVNLLDAVRDLGTSQAIIREQRLTAGILSSVFWLNLGTGLLAVLLMSLLGGPVALYFHEPVLRMVMPVVGLMLLLDSLAVVPYAMLVRRMDFRPLAIAQVGSILTGLVVAVVLALRGGGVWSLIYCKLVASAIQLGVSWWYAPVPLVAGPRFSELRHMMGFGLNLSLTNFVNFVSRYTDNVIVGAGLGAAALGVYQLAYNVVMYPLLYVSDVIAEVAFPAFLQVRGDDGRFRASYIRASRAVGWICFPAMLGLAVVAGPFVHTLLGKDWGAAVTLLRIFAPLGMLQAVFHLVQIIYKATGRTDLMLRWSIGSAAVSIAAFCIGLRWGALGVTASYAIAWTLMMIPGLIIAFSLVKLRIVDFLRGMWAPFEMSAAMALVATLWLAAIDRFLAPPPAVQLVSTICVGVAIYIGLLRSLRPAGIEDLELMVSRLPEPFDRYGMIALGAKPERAEPIVRKPVQAVRGTARQSVSSISNINHR